MDFTQFIHKVTEGVQEFIGEDAHVEVRKITKNNNVVLDGLVILKKGQNISPTIYLQDYYEQYQEGKRIGAIVYEIMRLYETQQPAGSFDASFFLHYDMVKSRIVYKLIHYDRNEQLLQEIPHIPYLDLAIVFYCMLHDDTFGNATILIYENHCQLWNVTAAELYEAAQENTGRLLPHEIRSMAEILQEAPGIEESEIRGKAPMYVLSNRMKLFGAAAMLYPNLLHAFAETIGQDFYILPSSVHEVILLPDSGDIKPDYLEDMVKEVNTTQVELQEILSDRVYKYVKKYDKIDFSIA